MTEVPNSGPSEFPKRPLKPYLDLPKGRDTTPRRRPRASVRVRDYPLAQENRVPLSPNLPDVNANQQKKITKPTDIFAAIGITAPNAEEIDGSERDQKAFVKAYKAAQKLGKEAAQTERRKVAGGRKPWGLYNSSVRTYDMQFVFVDNTDSTTILERRKAEKGKVLALDVMGTARFSEMYPVDGEVAITLVDFRTDAQKITDAVQNRHVIEKSVLDPATWRDLSAFVRNNDTTELPGIDLADCRPAWGWDTLRPNLYKIFPSALFWIPAQGMFQSLSGYGGRMRIKMPVDSDYEGWVDRINAMDGVQAQSTGPMVVIKKIGDPKDFLPLPRHEQSYTFK